MFRIHLLPAAHGDALILEYGAADAVRRVLIDGGPDSGGRALSAWLDAMPPAQRHFELLVITHVDADHIAGVLRLLAADPPRASFAQVWFNGYPHLEPDAPPPANDVEYFGAVQGERLSERLLALKIPWNRDFGGGAVRVRDDQALPRVQLPGGLTLTVLGPTAAKLATLKPVWERECEKAGLDPLSVPPSLVDDGIEPMGAIDIDTLADAPFEEDDAPANGSSIALLAEYEGRRVLLAGDAHPSTLLAAITRLSQGGGPLVLDAFKLPHHASKHNVSQALIEAVSCPRFLVSTNGAYFKHPDREAVARIVKYGDADSAIVFNYRNTFTRVWDDPLTMGEWDYRVIYPAEGEPVTRVDLA